MSNSATGARYYLEKQVKSNYIILAFEIVAQEAKLQSRHLIILALVN